MTRYSVLFGTTDPAKFKLMQSFITTLPVTLLSPHDLGLNLNVVEDGRSSEENAHKKAATYYAHARMPTIALDAGLTIDQFPAEKQPGVYVRRIYGATQEVSDEEMIRHYQSELARAGGQSSGCWHVAIAFATGIDQVHCATYTVPVLLTAEICATRIPGAPLSSLMRDPDTGQYFAEIDVAGRPDTEQIRQVLAGLLNKLPPEAPASIPA